MVRNTLGGKSVHADGKQESIAHQVGTEHRRCHGRYEQGYDVTERHVQHEYFEHEYHSRDRSIENAAHRAGRPATHHQHKGFLVHLEKTAEVGTYGRARKHYRGFRADRTAKAYGYGTRHHRRIHVVGFEYALALRYGIKYFRNAVSYVVFDYIFDKQSRKQYAYRRIYEVKPIARSYREMLGKQGLEKMYQEFKQAGGKGGRDTYQKAEKHNEMAGRDMPVAPTYESIICVAVFFHCNDINTRP